MRLATILLASVLIGGAAQAQVVSPLGGSTNTPQGPAPAAPAAPSPSAASPSASSSSGPAVSSQSAPATPRARTQRGRRSLTERFEAANTTHDGKLTLAQAKDAHMNAVARDFAQIDKERHGYVTLDDIRAFQKARREARRAARGPAQPQ